MPWVRSWNILGSPLYFSSASPASPKAGAQHVGAKCPTANIRDCIRNKLASRVVRTKKKTQCNPRRGGGPPCEVLDSPSMHNGGASDTTKAAQPEPRGSTGRGAAAKRMGSTPARRPVLLGGQLGQPCSGRPACPPPGTHWGSEHIHARTHAPTHIHTQTHLLREGNQEPTTDNPNVDELHSMARRSHSTGLQTPRQAIKSNEIVIWLRAFRKTNMNSERHIHTHTHTQGLEEAVAEDVARPLFLTRHGRANTLDT